MLIFFSSNKASSYLLHHLTNFSTADNKVNTVSFKLKNPTELWDLLSFDFVENCYNQFLQDEIRHWDIHNHRGEPEICKCQGLYRSKNIRKISFKTSVSTMSWSTSKSPACVLIFTGDQQQLQEKREAQLTDGEEERSKWSTQWRNHVTNAFAVTINYFWKSHADAILNSYLSH